MGRPIRINRKLVFAETTCTSKGKCLDSKPDLLNYSTFAAMVPTSRDAPLVHLAFGTAQQGCTESTFTHDVTSLVALESLELE